MMKILIVGGGNMGASYMANFTQVESISKDNLYILDRNKPIIEGFELQGYKHTYTSPGDYITEMDLVVIAIKPQDRAVLFEQLRPYLRPNMILMSVLAGIGIQTLKEESGLSKIIRVMPNLPAKVEMGMSGYAVSKEVSSIELDFIQKILDTTGKAICFEEEKNIDVVTAISGSGTAYVYYFMQAMVEAGMELGIRRETSYALVEQTFMGALELIRSEKLSPEEWMNRVSSKGGTTRAALDKFNEEAVDVGIKSGMRRAFERALELGKELVA